jgi:hypothetical protein
MASHIRRNKIVAAFFAVLMTAPFTQARRNNPYYPFASRNDYRSKLHVLRGLVRRYGRKSVNRIYVAKLIDLDTTSRSPFLYGYWPEDHSIWLVGNLDPSFNNGREATDYAWLKYKMRTDLRKDVVPTVEDIGGSSYLVDRPWTRRIINACLTRGRRIIIRRPTRP